MPIYESIFKSLPTPIIVVDKHLRVCELNAAAEDLLLTSLNAIKGKDISQCFSPSAQVVFSIKKAFETQQIVREYDVTLSGLKMGTKHVNLHAAPLVENPNEPITKIILQIEPAGAAPRMASTAAEKPVASMAAILAHEVKNPLSGIRGAAQILEKHASDATRSLTVLIRDEVDRITTLINEMEVFSHEGGIHTQAVNIHEVLRHVKTIAENGFAKHIGFKEIYDPSLPHVEANRDSLVQLFLNLVKNAAEALFDKPDGYIHLITAYSGGYRFKPTGREDYMLLPVAITIEDNAGGIPESIKPNLFSPFITSKSGGKGLGLAIVSRIVSDHNGHIELEEGENGITRFKILLPAAKS
jgi:two-component system nitrogen regulation sensor histidine kinase GlnL